MLLVSNVNSNNLQKRKSNLSFGTNLIISKDAADRLEKNPDDKKDVQEFKEFLAKDGKNWNAELTYDTYMKSDKTPEQIYEEKMKSFDWLEKEGAAFQIKEMADSDKAAFFVQRMVNDKNEYVKRHGASVAGEIKDPKIAAQTVISLLKDPDSDIRYAAAQGVGNIDSPIIAAGLIMKLSKHPEHQIRENSAFSAGEIQDEMTRYATISKLAASDDVYVKRGVADSLRKIDNPELFQKLVAQTYSFDDDKVKEIIMRNMQWSNNVKGSTVTDAIIEDASKNKNKEIRGGAAGSISKMLNQEKAVELIDKLTKDESGWVRRDAARSVGSLKDSKLAAEKIQQLMQSADPEVKESVIEGIHDIKDKKIKNELVEKLADSNDPMIKKNMIDFVDELKDSKKAALLIEDVYKNSLSSSQRTSYLSAVGNIKDDETRNQLLEKYTKSPNAEDRKNSIDAVIKSFDKDQGKAKEYLTTLSNDKDEIVSSEAKNAIKNLQYEDNYYGQNHYKLNITDGETLLGKENVEKNYKTNSKIALNTAYDSIISKFATKPTNN